MIDQEKLPGGIQSHFWVKIDAELSNPSRSPDKPLYFSPLLSEYSVTTPKVTHGGWLADEMGLGKTICTLGLIRSMPAPELVPDNYSMWGEVPLGSKALVKSQGTLVICPVSLVAQWYDEAVAKLQMGSKSVYRYYGSSRVRDPEVLAKYDIVITT
jgi:SWI/SNF-related matrix-associated actin-dependent regulator of chromatin subfamily A3